MHPPPDDSSFHDRPIDARAVEATAVVAVAVAVVVSTADEWQGTFAGPHSYDCNPNRMAVVAA